MHQWVKVFTGRFEYATKWNLTFLTGGKIVGSNVSVCYVDILRRGARGQVLVVVSMLEDTTKIISALEVINAVVQRFQLDPRRTTFAMRTTQETEELWLWEIGWSGYTAKDTVRRPITRKKLGLE